MGVIPSFPQPEMGFPGVKNAHGFSAKLVRQGSLDLPLVGSSKTKMEETL